MRKLMAAIIASLIGLIALSVSNTAVACGVARYSSDGKRSRRPKAPSAHKKGLHPTMKAFYFSTLSP